MKLIDDIRAILRREPPEVDPWKGYDPNAPPEPEITDEDIIKDIQKTYQPKKEAPSIMVRLTQFFMILWSLGHFVLLYVMLGSPISGGILVYVLVDLAIFSHYFILLRKVNQNE